MPQAILTNEKFSWIILHALIIWIRRNKYYAVHNKECASVRWCILFKKNKKLFKVKSTQHLFKWKIQEKGKLFRAVRLLTTNAENRNSLCIGIAVYNQSYLYAIFYYIWIIFQVWDWMLRMFATMPRTHTKKKQNLSKSTCDRAIDSQ